MPIFKRILSGMLSLTIAVSAVPVITTYADESSELYPLIQLPGTDDLIDICNTNSMWFSDDFMYTNYLIINCKKDIA